MKYFIELFMKTYRILVYVISKFVINIKIEYKNKNNLTIMVK